MNVNLRETIAASSSGIVELLFTDATKDLHDLPIIVFTILSKKNILASPVPSDIINDSFYLQKRKTYYV
jgi:hypothetical protein